MVFENKNKVEYSLIAGFPENRVIGDGLKIPWYIPEDFKLFKEKTIGSTIIMGQNTWDSLPKKPLPNRVNIVLNRDSSKVNEGAKTFTNLDDAFDYASSLDNKIFVIGGASIYSQTIDSAKFLYISHIKGEFNGDVFFPEFDKNNYDIVTIENYDDFNFKLYKRKN